MVTATDNPRMLRVSFSEEETEKNRSEIVCMVEATLLGDLKIVYQHHASQSRPTGKGEWDPRFVVRHNSLSLALESNIRTHVMYELFSTFAGVGTISVQPSTVPSILAKSGIS